MRRGTTAGTAAGVACAVLALSVPAPAGAEQVKLGDVQRAITNLAKTDGVVGAIGEVYVGGERVGKGTAGSRLLGGKGGRIPSDSRFRIASQTKLMEATVVLQLVGEGKLGLDGKLGDLLPEHDFPDGAETITVRDLIRHTSGIPDFLESGAFDVFDFTTAYKPIDLVKAAYTLPLGELGRYRYSTTNYVLLGMIIERVTGHDRAVEFKRRLFAPLGMKSTYLATRVSDRIKGPHGHGYSPDAKGRPRDVDRLNATSYGAEGAISTAHDVSAFYRALGQGKLVPADLQRQLPRPFPGLCGGTVSSASGGMPGITSTTFSSADGRIQFAVAATLKVDNEKATAVGEAVNRAAEAVLCPGP
ncbi:serine hydrolase domain-containing protein [Nonomuraea sp. SBT364]|uniref:serine hydrolase domain-containing protein n=1 Tax=Nonomuraea sp. SBT364 TaxID=1580530 RepID=UPI00066A9B40|nr:serine hydrolase domain-containing protein [Nonomuraea sp. SBT364]